MPEQAKVSTAHKKGIYVKLPRACRTHKSSACAHVGALLAREDTCHCYVSIVDALQMRGPPAANVHGTRAFLHNNVSRKSEKGGVQRAVLPAGFGAQSQATVRVKVK